jgi:cardiolipin synthase
VARTSLTARRLVGLDRSGPPPAETLPGQPLRPWTIPNAIGFTRLALVPVFLVVALRSEDGTDLVPALLYAVIAWSDYADGIAARVTGQYSRLGALLDPVVDRLLVVAGVIVCYRFELLPRWALVLLALREVVVFWLGQQAVRRGRPLKINWPGRLGVWPVWSAIFAGLVGWGDPTGTVLLYVGLVLVWLATALYVRDGLQEPSTSR